MAPARYGVLLIPFALFFLTKGILFFRTFREIKAVAPGQYGAILREKKMKKIKTEELMEKIAEHQKWLRDKTTGKRLDASFLDFSYVNFYKIDFHGANFHDANFIGANFHDADFCGANFCGANFCGANNINEVISFANIANTALCMQCPEEGSFIGFKKADGGIVKLRVTESAKRSSATTHKCRCSEAEVLEIQNMDGTKSERTSVISKYDRNFIYSVGTIVSVSDFDDDRWNECARGIHFFLSRQEAVNY